MQRSFLHCILFVLCCHNSEAQAERIMPLKIGNYIPDIHFENVIGRNQKEKGFGQLKGKLVILDFWNVRCKGCLHAMPHLDSQQKNFQDKLRIILVTKNNLAEINGLFSKIKIKFPDLPCIINDTVFNKLFPHEGEPFQAWIGVDGKVKYLTSDYNASNENIQAVLKGNELSIINFRPYEDSNSSSPLLNRICDSNASFQWADTYSLLTRRMQQLERNAFIKIERDSLSHKAIRITAINQPILALFNLAFNPDVYGYEKTTFNYEHNNRVIYEMNRPENLMMPSDFQILDLWKNKNLFSYEVQIPPNAYYSIYDRMQNDLNSFFDIVGSIEKRKRKCIVLIDSLMQTHHSMGGQSKMEYNGNESFKIQNEPLTSLVRELASIYSNLNTPIIDGTNETANIDIQLNCDLGNMSQLQNELKKNGLHLVEQEREINMLVLRDKK